MLDKRLPDVLRFLYQLLLFGLPCLLVLGSRVLLQLDIVFALKELLHFSDEIRLALAHKLDLHTFVPEDGNLPLEVELLLELRNLALDDLLGC